MMKEHKKQHNPYRIFDEDDTRTNACTECTGLMPTPPSCEEEWETYQDIFQFTPTPDTGKDSSDHSPKEK